MGDAKAVVKTDVDRLIALIEEKKDISVPDAAKQLSLPTSTIEALGDILEEEGIVHIKYKFTTPYLIYGKAAGVGKAAKAAKEEIQESEVPELPIEAPLPDVGALMDVKKEFFDKAKQRGMPDDKAAQLFEKYIANHSDFIKEKFFENARQLKVPEDRMDGLWEEYLKKLKGEAE